MFFITIVILWTFYVGSSRIVQTCQWYQPERLDFPQVFLAPSDAFWSGSSGSSGSSGTSDTPEYFDFTGIKCIKIGTGETNLLEYCCIRDKDRPSCTLKKANDGPKPLPVLDQYGDPEDPSTTICFSPPSEKKCNWIVSIDYSYAGQPYSSKVHDTLKPAECKQFAPGGHEMPWQGCCHSEEDGRLSCKTDPLVVNGVTSEAPTVKQVPPKGYHPVAIPYDGGIYCVYK